MTIPPENAGDSFTALLELPATKTDSSHRLISDPAIENHIACPSFNNRSGKRKDFEKKRLDWEAVEVKIRRWICEAVEVEERALSRFGSAFMAFCWYHSCSSTGDYLSLPSSISSNYDSCSIGQGLQCTCASSVMDSFSRYMLSFSKILLKKWQRKSEAFSLSCKVQFLFEFVTLVLKLDPSTIVTKGDEGREDGVARAVKI